MSSWIKQESSNISEAFRFSLHSDFFSEGILSVSGHKDWTLNRMGIRTDVSLWKKFLLPSW